LTVRPASSQHQLELLTSAATSGYVVAFLQYRGDS